MRLWDFKIGSDKQIVPIKRVPINESLLYIYIFFLLCHLLVIDAINAIQLYSDFLLKYKYNLNKDRLFG